MGKSKTSSIPCPHCDYVAFSQVDLDGHISFAHSEGRPKAEASQPATTATAEASQPEATEATETETDVSVDMASPEDELPSGIFIPDPQPDFWVSEVVGRELYVIGKRSGRGEQVNVKVVGPAGVGKTSLGWEFAAAYKRPCFEVHWGMYQEPGEVWGRDRLSMEHGTYYEQARYVDALETPDCVIILDEPNRCHPEVLNTNFALWDWRRAAWVPDLGRMVKVAPGVVFFACMNEGGEYIGVNPMDKAIRERFTRTIRLDFPPVKAETEILVKRTGVEREVAEKLATFARDVRRNPKLGCAPSTRQLLVACEDVAEGSPLPQAVMFCIVNDLDETVDRQALLQHLQIIGNIDDAFVGGNDD